MKIDQINTRKLAQELFVIMKNPQATLFEGKAIAVTATNDKGIFDIIPYHTNFISLIKDYVIIHEIEDIKKTYPIQTGIMKVFENTVSIYLGIKTE